MREQAIEAENYGRHTFNTGKIDSHKNAEKYARKTYNSSLLRDCFVAGWNQAYWDEQGRILKASNVHNN